MNINSSLQTVRNSFFLCQKTQSKRIPRYSLIVTHSVATRKCNNLRRLNWAVGLSFFLSTASYAALVPVLSFEQLNWIGSASSTPDSRWGRVTLDFIGESTTQYVNLEVNGNWVIQNMAVDSLYGVGVSQGLTTTFDLGGFGDVTNINYAFSANSSPLSSFNPAIILSTSVADLDYQIGGEGGIDLGSLSAPETQIGNNQATVTSSAKLPNIDKVVNQVQGKNECAPGAISNSLKYLQATGKLDGNIATDIADIKPIIDWDMEGAPPNWFKLKDKYFSKFIPRFHSYVLSLDDITGLMDAIKKGRNVELDLNGHVALIAGVRKFSDGRVELDIFDDNQKDNVEDKMKTVQIINGKVDTMSIDGYVVEFIPEPGSLSLSVLGLLGLLFVGRRKFCNGVTCD